MPLTATLAASVIADQSAAIDLGTVAYPLRKYATVTLANGTGAGQADQLWTDQRTIAASGTDDLDLAGSLTNAFGATVTFARIKSILVTAAAGNTNNVLVGGAASAQFLSWVGSATDKVVVRPGGFFALGAGAADAIGYVVTATTADLLRIANSGAGTGVTYDISILGCTA